MGSRFDPRYGLIISGEENPHDVKVFVDLCHFIFGEHIDLGLKIGFQGVSIETPLATAFGC